MKLHMQEKKKTTKKKNRDTDLHTQECMFNLFFFGATLFHHGVSWHTPKRSDKKYRCVSCVSLVGHSSLMQVAPQS